MSVLLSGFKTVLTLGIGFGVIAVVGWLRGEVKQEQPSQQSLQRGGRRNPRHQQQESNEMEMQQLVETIQRLQAEEEWEQLADIMNHQREAARNVSEFILCSLLEMGYRYNAGQHEQSKNVILSLEKVLRKVPWNHNQYLQLGEMTISFGYLKEAEVVVRQGLILAQENNEPLNIISHLENISANILASTNRLKEARAKVEAIKKKTGESNPPLSVSQFLATEDAQFVTENGKVLCKMLFKRNAGMTTDSPRAKKNIFPKGFTLKCSFEHPEGGKGLLEKTYTMQKSGCDTFDVHFEYPFAKKGNYAIEVEVFEDDEQAERAGYHMVVAHCDFDKAAA